MLVVLMEWVASRGFMGQCRFELLDRVVHEEAGLVGGRPPSLPIAVPGEAPHRYRERRAAHPRE